MRKFVFIIRGFLGALRSPITTRFLLQAQACRAAYFILVLLLLCFVTVRGEHCNLVNMNRRIMMRSLFLSRLLKMRQARYLFRTGTQVNYLRLLCKRKFRCLLRRQAREESQSNVVLGASLYFVGRLSQVPRCMYIHSIHNCRIGQFLGQPRRTAAGHLQCVVTVNGLNVFPRNFRMINGSFIPTIHFDHLVNRITLRFNMTRGGTISGRQRIKTGYRCLFNIIIR